MKKNNLLFYICLSLLITISLLGMHNLPLINPFYQNYFLKQIIWFSIGIILFILSKNIPLKYYQKYSLIIYIINIILLILVLIIGNPINGSKAWLQFKFFSIEPSEFMKISLILVLGSIKNKQGFKYLFKIFIYTLLPIILVFLEPDTGQIIIYLLIFLTFLYCSKLKVITKLLITILGLSIITTLIWLYLNNPDFIINIFGTSLFYRIDRLINFKNNYQLENALIVIGSSSKYILKLNHISLYIPESPTDFFFAFLIGSFGYYLGILIIILYFIIIISIINKRNMISIPLLIIFSFQVIYNISMNLGIVPIMGIPLPFLSYGGTNIISYLILFGLLFNKDDNIDNHKNYKSHCYKALDKVVDKA